MLAIRVMTRKRYHWDFKCKMTPQEYFEKLWSIRRYFYSVEEQL